MRQQAQFDVLILGSGAAGLSLALKLPDNLHIGVLSKCRLEEGSTYYAQGGISAVLDKSDSLDAHVQDTLNAGGGLCDLGVVQRTVQYGPAAVQWLIDLGVPFTHAPDGDTGYHLTREGGHSTRRVIHADDATGAAIENTLVRHARESKHIEILEHCIAIDLITGAKMGLSDNRCLGVYALNLKNRKVSTLAAKMVILASGGASKVYLYTSNPDGSTGDGMAMGWRAGCRLANLEFIQFHPTCLYHPKAKSFLISEAVRGEGGKLLLENGDRFMARFDEREELAPRDIVARAIDHEMKRTGADCVYLDISHKGDTFIKQHFPNIYTRCLELGYDMAQEPVPVVPAAHYSCGGVLTDMNGRTDLPGLYAIGEVACTGMHGANRMASNSLLECLVFAQSAAKDISATIHNIPDPPALPEWDESRVTDSDEEIVVSHNWDELRRFMWDYVGIVRTTKRLQRADHRVQLLLGEISEYYGNFRVSSDLIELRNLSLVGSLIIRSALARRESRGLHYTLDYPGSDSSIQPRHTVLVPDNFAAGLSTPHWSMVASSN